MPNHPDECDMRDRLKDIVEMAQEALATDPAGKPNMLRVALSQIENTARVPEWPI